jgi:hypothetical protein
MIRYLVCLWSVVALLGNVNAQGKNEPNISVKVQYDTVGMNERFQVEYKFENVKNVNFANADFPGFEIVSGPFQSSQFSMVNGKTSSSVSITYLLQPLEKGFKTINSQKVYLDDNQHYTPEITVFVVEELNREDIVGQNRNPFGNDFFGFDDSLMEKLQKQQNEMMKRHQEFFNNPDDFFNNPGNFFNMPKMFGPDLNDMLKNFDQMFQYKAPPGQTPKTKEKTYKL